MKLSFIKLILKIKIQYFDQTKWEAGLAGTQDYPHQVKDGLFGKHLDCMRIDEEPATRRNLICNTS